VHGENDEICLNKGGRFMNDRIPGSQLLMLPDTGHMPFISRRERVVEAVLKFLSMYEHTAHD
jgi:pimeloyl-ACP methyl ester carboxylesterase